MYSVGVQTVILLASIFGTKDLGLETSNLIITILLIQLVGVVGAFVFSRLSENGIPQAMTKHKLILKDVHF